MKLREVVHGPAVSCGPSTPLVDVVRLMRLHEVGSVVVVDDDGSVVGIATDRDIALKAVGTSLGADAPVERVMTHSVLTIDIDADTHDAASLMFGHGVRRLPVVDAAGRLQGVVSFDDLVIFVEKEGDTLRRVLEVVNDKRTGGWAGGWD